MKNNVFIVCAIFLLILPGCMYLGNTPSSIIEVTIITREITQNVTRLRFIDQTIIPTLSPTPTPSCYDTAQSQYELTGCATSIARETKNKLDKLVNQIANEFSTSNPPKKNEFLQFESEWEALAEKECVLWWGSVTDYGWWEHGSMAPMLVSICLNDKYEKRIEELKMLL